MAEALINGNYYVVLSSSSACSGLLNKRNNRPATNRTVWAVVFNGREYFRRRETRVLKVLKVLRTSLVVSAARRLLVIRNNRRLSCGPGAIWLTSVQRRRENSSASIDIRLCRQ